MAWPLHSSPSGLPVGAPKETSMNTARQRLLLATVAALVGAGLLLGPRVHKAHADDDTPSIAGSWQVRDPNDPTFGAVSTFHRDHTFIASPANTNVTDGMGPWTRSNDDCHTFLLTSVHVRRDANGHFVGTLEQLQTITLSDDGNSFTATDLALVLDPSGNEIARHSDQRTGTRIVLLQDAP